MSRPLPWAQVTAGGRRVPGHIPTDTRAARSRPIAYRPPAAHQHNLAPAPGHLPVILPSIPCAHDSSRAGATGRPSRAASATSGATPTPALSCPHPVARRRVRSVGCRCRRSCAAWYREQTIPRSQPHRLGRNGVQCPGASETKTPQDTGRLLLPIMTRIRRWYPSPDLTCFWRRIHAHSHRSVRESRPQRV